MHSDAATTLIPGYRQVEQFDSEDEYEEGEEVEYITLDLGNVEPTLVPSASSYHLIGLDTPTPFLQLQGTVLKGRHHRLLGTEMVFTENKETEKRTIQHVANTEQRILFKEVTLQPKSPVASPPQPEKVSDVTMTEVLATVGGSGSTAHASLVSEDGQRIDRMTGKAAPVTRAPRTKGAPKKKNVATDESTPRSSKGKERAQPDADSESLAPPSDTDAAMDTT